MKSKLGVGNAFSALGICAAIGTLAAGGPAAMAAPSQCDGVAGNLVANCGFETASNLGIAANWSTGGTRGVAFSLMGYERTGARAMDVNFDAPGSSFISQVVGGAGTYNVSFWLDLYSSGVPSNLSPTLSITLGDQALNVSLPVTNTQNNNYRFFAFSNVTTATAAALKFQVSGNTPATQYYDLFIDDVVVTSVSVSPAVPEPSSLALGLGGLAGLALCRRRQQRGQAAA